MSILERAGAFLGWAKTPQAVRAEIEEEIRFHLEEREKELIAAGARPEEANARARELFGDIDRTALECLTIQMGARVMMQRIQWLIIAVLVLSLGGLWFLHQVTIEKSRARMAMMRAENSELLAQSALGSRTALGHAFPDEGLKALEAMRQQGSDDAPPLVYEKFESPTAITARWLALFGAKPEDWRHGYATANALVSDLSADEALRVISEIWSELSEPHRKQTLKAVAFLHGHPETLAILHLGATDEFLEVQNWALQYLRPYSFQSLSDDYEAYLEWYAEWGELALGEVLSGNARAFAEGLHGRSPEELDDLLRDFRRLDLRVGKNLDVDVPEVLRDSGALGLLEEWLASDHEDARERAFSWAPALGADEQWLRRYVLPFVEESGENRRLASSALKALGSPENTWAIPTVVDYMERTVPRTVDDSAHSDIWSAAGTLADIGDPAAIPTMIGLIALNPCYDTVYGIGYFGLGKLTGVSYDESHDGDWWIEWWQQNHTRFPPEVRTIPIPDYSSDH